MSPEEVIDKFVSFELMVKDSKHIVDWKYLWTFRCPKFWVVFSGFLVSGIYKLYPKIGSMGTRNFWV
jgi:hypothetical protein